MKEIEIAIKALQIKDRGKRSEMISYTSGANGIFPYLYSPETVEAYKTGLSLFFNRAGISDYIEPNEIVHENQAYQEGFFRRLYAGFSDLPDSNVPHAISERYRNLHNSALIKFERDKISNPSQKDGNTYLSGALRAVMVYSAFTEDLIRHYEESSETSEEAEALVAQYSFILEDLEVEIEDLNERLEIPTPLTSGEKARLGFVKHLLEEGKLEK